MNIHYGITCKLNCYAKHSNSKLVTFRRLKTIDVARFKEDIHMHPLLTSTTGSVDEITENYSERLMSLLDIHAPTICSNVIQRPNAPWYTDSLRAAKRERRTLERKWCNSKMNVDKVAYRNQCSIVAKQLNDTKEKYFSDKLDECPGDTKMLHKITDKLLVNQHIQLLPTDDDDTHLANVFSNYFANKIDNIRQNFSLPINLEQDTPPDIRFDHFRPLSVEELRKVINCYTNKSCELDSIPTWLVKLCLDDLLPLLTAVINTSLESGVFPAKFKETLIRPLLKKHNLDPEELKSYRPVSNLHFISKITEKIASQRLEEHLNIHSLHDPFQSAYKINHSTETAIIKISNDIITSLDRGRCTILVSLDLSAAFDTVDHDIFINRLKSVYGAYGTAHALFKSYLLNRHYRVCINSSFSEKHKLKCGVPQGSVLGARMYTMYTEPMRTLITKHQVSYHSYADDTQLYVHCDNDETSIQLAIKRLEHCIADVCKWMKSNALKLNEEKTEFIIFGVHPSQHNTVSLTIGRNDIKLSESSIYTDLGRYSRQ